jgi:hypothetical protein
VLTVKRPSALSRVRSILGLLCVAVYIALTNPTHYVLEADIKHSELSWIIPEFSYGIVNSISQHMRTVTPALHREFANLDIQSDLPLPSVGYYGGFSAVGRYP